MMVPATLVLDGEMTAKEVKARLAPTSLIAGMDAGDRATKRIARHDERAVVIRRRHAGDILWYVRTVGEVRRALEGAKASRTLTEVLDLHEHERAKTRELRAMREKGAGRFEGVVLDGERVAGVVLKPAPAPKQPPKPAAAAGGGRGAGGAIGSDDNVLFGDEGEEEELAFGEEVEWEEQPMGAGGDEGAREGSRGATRGASRGGGLGRRGLEGLRGGRGDVYARGGGGRGVDRTETRTAARGPTANGGSRSAGAERPRNGGGRGGRAAARSPDAPAATSPQRAFPLVKAPDIVRSRQELTLTVGLAKAPMKGVTGDAMTINVPVEEETFTLDVQVSAAEGFKAPKGWRHELTLKSSNIYKGRVEIPLVAPEVTGESLFSVLSVHFSHDGVHLGTATRRIEVARSLARGKQASAWVRATPRPAAMTMDMTERAPDLTIRIEKPDADEATGKFVWTFETPHKGIKRPAKPLPMNLGTDARTFAKTWITLIDEQSGEQLLTGTMRGIGTKIAQKVPAEAWRVIADVGAKVGKARPMTVLLYSAETSVPWELAVMPKPLDPKKPPYLGAQVALGRWILGTNGPSVPPARSVNVEKMAIVTGYYKAGSKLSRLEGAEEESKLLQKAYGAVALDATPENVRQLFEGTIADADDIHAIHFACHGEVQPGAPELNAIFLSDGSPLNEFVFLGAQIGERSKPILFLNACQVGTQGELLGESAGFGAGCLYAGFRAFVAPLWSIDDATAREVALDFYRTAFDAKKRTFVSSFFQDIRTKFAPKSKTDVPESTYLAYVYYGHPELLLST